jgi:hypothetical protein
MFRTPCTGKRFASLQKAIDSECIRKMRTAAEPTLKLGGMFVWEKWPEFFRGVDRLLKRPDQLGDLSSRHRLVLLACTGDSLVDWAAKPSVLPTSDGWFSTKLHAEEFKWSPWCSDCVWHAQYLAREAGIQFTADGIMFNLVER